MALFPKAYHKMGESGPSMASRLQGARGGISIRLALSYASDWIVLLLCVAVSAVLGHINPAKRPFSLVNPDISFPFTENELVPTYLLLILVAGVPIVTIPLVCLFLVPGPTVPKGTPKALVWRRKLWELHIGWLGLALALVAAWTFTESMKNIFGKPRPDLIARCKPDMDNIEKYIVGGKEWGQMHGQLVSADICTQTSRSTLNDGFRSYPSGHSSSSAAGLIYLSLFLASKFSVTFPYVMPSAASAAGAAGRSAFPSRSRSAVDPYEPTRSASSPYDKNVEDEFHQNIKIQSLRNQAAAPPLYLLVLTVLPFGLAVFIASSRWYDFRHHGFDILFGFLMGTATSIYSFFYYHMPIRDGAGWAWGPRSDERAFWAGVGRLGFVDDEDEEIARRGAAAAARQDVGLTANTAYPSMTSGVLTQRPMPAHQQEHYDTQERPPFQDVELQRMSPALSDERDHHPHRPPHA